MAFKIISESKISPVRYFNITTFNIAFPIPYTLQSWGASANSPKRLAHPPTSTSRNGTSYLQAILIKKQGYCDPKKEPLGHSMLEMKERYAHLALKNSQRTVATLENFFNRSDVIDINRTSENS